MLSNHTHHSRARVGSRTDCSLIARCGSADLIDDWRVVDSVRHVEATFGKTLNPKLLSVGPTGAFMAAAAPWCVNAFAN